jgi:hypothetical protein
MQEDEALQRYNRDFFDNNQDFYFTLEKRMITAKAQGNEPIDASIYYMLDSLCVAMHAYLFDAKRHAAGLNGIDYFADRLEVIPASRIDQNDEKIEWDKAGFEEEISSYFNTLKAIPETDFFHQKLSHSDLVNYNRSYTEEQFLDELSELELSILKTSEAIPINAGRLNLFEFINLANSSILVAERKALRFLEEHYMNANLLHNMDSVETYISSDQITYAPGSKIQLEVFPSFISSPNLFVKRYTITGPEINDSFLIKGRLNYEMDTIWLPTDRVGDYKVSGSAINFMRPSQEHEFEYLYKVIEE